MIPHLYEDNLGLDGPEADAIYGAIHVIVGYVERIVQTHTITVQIHTIILQKHTIIIHIHTIMIQIQIHTSMKTTWDWTDPSRNPFMVPYTSLWAMWNASLSTLVLFSASTCTWFRV